MQDCGAFHVSIFKVLILVIFNGLYVALADTEMVLKTGSSLDLPFNNPIESVVLVQWKLNGSTLVEYSTYQNYTFRKSQFSGRLKEIYNRVGVTVQDLQPKDSGIFSVVADSLNSQYKTQIFKVYVQSPITSVQIEKSQTWRLYKNSCNVDIKCEAPGVENVSYTWSGYKTASGSQLQFSLSPADGNVTLDCTAANNVSNSRATETLICAPVSVLKLISTLMAASSYLLVTVILCVKCYRAHRYINDQCAMEVIEE